MRDLQLDLVAISVHRLFPRDHFTRAKCLVLAKLETR